MINKINFRKPLLIAIIVFSSLHSNAQWDTLTCCNSGFLFYSFFLNYSVGWVLSDNPHLYSTTDYGSSWNYVSTPPGLNPFFIDKDTGFTEQIGIFKTVDGGLNWSTVLSTNYFISSVYFSPDRSYAFASGVNFTEDSIVIFKSTDRGNSWNLFTAINTGIIQVVFSSITFTSPDTGYITGDGIRKTTNGGLNWIMLDNNPAYMGIYFPAPDTGYALSTGIAKTTDGQHWSNLPNGGFVGMNSAAFLSTNEGYVVGDDLSGGGFIKKTIDGGQNWVTEKTTPLALYSVNFPSTNFGYAFGPYGAVYKRQSSTLVSEALTTKTIDAFPNPSNGIFHLTSICKKYEANIKIYNSIGSLLKTTPFENEIDLSSLGKGIYIAKINDSTTSEILKLVVK